MSVNLMEYSSSGGCGCKVSKDVLDEILLDIGTSSYEDSAIHKIDDVDSLVLSCDFFTPIVNDAFSFGAIAAANALSDIYAMGAKPISALSILGYPVSKIKTSVIKTIINGAQYTCNKAGIRINGGHTINNNQVVFGLSVTGKIKSELIKYNSNAKENDLIYLLKPLGVGIISTAHKRGLVNELDLNEAITHMMTINSIGAVFADLKYVNSVTDVTGFGLLGHLLEMCENSNLQAIISYKHIPKLTNISEFISLGVRTSGGIRNLKNVENKVIGLREESEALLCDPQSNGGLLVSVDRDYQMDFEKIIYRHYNKNEISPIGEFKKKKENTNISIEVQDTI